MMSRKLSFLLIIFFSLAMNAAYADAKNDFQTGLSAFKSKQYEKAIRAFESARKQGMKSAALSYNLAVSYFKTGDYQQAKVWFNKARQYKNIKYLSEYNLGLVAIKQNDSTTALAHFRNVAKHARQENLIKLANYQIAQLTKTAAKPWSAFASIEYGHDDNVTIASNESPSKQASDYVDLYAYGSLRLVGTDKNGLLLDGYVLDTQYQSLPTEDMQFLSVGLEQAFTLGKWENAIGIDYLESTLGGQDFEKTIIYEVNTRHTLTTESEFRLRYRYYDIDSQPPYAELSGNKQRMRIEYRRSIGSDRLKLYYEYETNDRSETAATLGNYSPTRNTLRAAYTYAFSDKLDLTGDLSWRTSEYNDGNYGTLASPVIMVRDDTRTKADIDLSYYLSKMWFVTAEYSRTENDSNVPGYSYSRQVTSISVNALF